MITHLVIENFKAIKRLGITLTPFTVLIGGNSCGKSTILQALDFIRAFAMRDIDEYLHERGWLFDDLKSQFGNGGVGISVGLKLNINGTAQELTWTIAVDNIDGKFLTSETIKNTSKSEVILARGVDMPPIPDIIESLYLKSSYLKLIDENNPSAEYCEELYAVKKFFTQSSSYELLAPDRMREKGSRGETKDIGMGGEKLAAYINGMSAVQKSNLNKMFSELIGYAAKTTTEIKRSGWVDLFINESFSETKTKIKAAHISDGLLRLLGLVAASIPGEKDKHVIPQNAIIDVLNSGFVLLDEIEDGINPYLTEKVIAMLRMIISDFGKQIIITTHSPVMLNHFKQNEIIFMWRDDEGQIQAKPMFDTEGMLDTLDCFNPGEVWLNYSKDEILDLMDPSRMEGQK